MKKNLSNKSLNTDSLFFNFKFIKKYHLCIEKILLAAHLIHFPNIANYFSFHLHKKTLMCIIHHCLL